MTLQSTFAYSPSVTAFGMIMYCILKKERSNANHKEAFKKQGHIDLCIPVPTKKGESLG